MPRRPSSFPGVDFLNIDSQFSEEELLIRRTTRQFVDERVMPLIRDAYRDARFPRELVGELGALGFLGANLTGYNCAAINNVAYGLIMQELERGDSGLRSFASVQGALVMYPILTYGSGDQKQHWLPRLQSGDAIGCFGLTEPGYGSNPSGMLTRAQRDGDSWILNGEKTWITNGSIADIALIWAKADLAPEEEMQASGTSESGVPKKAKKEGILGFLVERNTPGFTASDIHGKLSMRASVTSTLTFSNCRIPDAARLPHARGLRAALACLTQARYGIGWGAIGAAMDCYETARAYSLTRTQFDNRPIASHQLVQQKLAHMITEITKAQLLALHCGRLKDAAAAASNAPHLREDMQEDMKNLGFKNEASQNAGSSADSATRLGMSSENRIRSGKDASPEHRFPNAGSPDPAHISMLKQNNVAMALDCARSARDLLGANGIIDDYPLMRHLSNLETVKTYEGTDHIHTLVIGERITGIAAYK